MSHLTSRTDDLGLGLCTEPRHLASGASCTRIIADEAASKLKDTEDTLRALRVLVSEAWRGLTFRPPMVAEFTDVHELVKLDALERRIEIILAAFEREPGEPA